MNRLDKLEHRARIITGADLPPSYGIGMNDGKMFIIEGKGWNQGTTPEEAHTANQDKIILCMAFNGVDEVEIIKHDDYMTFLDGKCSLGEHMRVLTGSDSIAGT